MAARPGFLNIRLDPAVWQAQLRAILRAGTAYGDSTLGGGERVNVEFVSANPTGPMHVGHGRGAVVGDALAALLAKAGFAVHREYYINDAGAQVDVARPLGPSALPRGARAKPIGRDPARGFYPGEYLIDDRPRAGRARRRQVARPAGGGVAGAGPRLRRRREMMALIRARPRRARRRASTPSSPSARWSRAGAVDACAGGARRARADL